MGEPKQYDDSEYCYCSYCGNPSAKDDDVSWHGWCPVCGAKINVGIDIINTLSTAYGVNVPLFVDNAESVTKLEATTSQIIRLVVSESDKELRVNYEN